MFPSPSTTLYIISILITPKLPTIESNILVAIALGVIHNHVQAASIKHLVKLLDCLLRLGSRNASVHGRLRRLIVEDGRIRAQRRAGEASARRASAASSGQSLDGGRAGC